MSTLKVNSIIPVAGVPTGGGGGITQIQQTIKTDTFSSTSSSFTDVTGLSVSLTPTSTSSKILVLTAINFAHSSENRINGRVVVEEGGSDSIIAQADADGSRVRAQFIGRHIASTGSSQQVNLHILHSPSSTNALTYKFQFSMVDGGTGQINFGINDTNSSSHSRGISTITVMEVSA